MSSSASSQLSPRPTTASQWSGTDGRSRTRSSTVLLRASISGTHSPTAESSASRPTATVYGARGRTANEASRSVAPTRAATPAAATTRSSPEPPKAAVTRVTRASGGARKPRGASATATGELCSSRVVTLPSVTEPAPPAADEPATIRLASCCSATSSSPAGVERARWTSVVTGHVLRQPLARRRERVLRGALEVRLVLGVHARRARRPRRRARPRTAAGRRPPSARACPRGAGPPGRARRARRPRAWS